MIYLNESCFKNKILIEMSLEALWEMLFENPSKGKEMVFNEMINPKIKQKQDIFYKNLEEIEMNPGYFYNTGISKSFLIACKDNRIYDFLLSVGMEIFPIFFIDSHRVHSELEKIKIETEEFKDSLTQEEYENLLTEQLIYSLENFAIIKKEEIKFLYKRQS